MSPRPVALAALAAIVLLHLVWHGWLAPPMAAPRWLVLLLAWLPAVPALVSWWRGGRLAPIWAGAASLFYFSHGVMEAWSTPPVRPLALLEVALAVTCVAAAGWPGLRRHRSVPLDRGH